MLRMDQPFILDDQAARRAPNPGVTRIGSALHADRALCIVLRWRGLGLCDTNRFIQQSEYPACRKCMPFGCEMAVLDGEGCRAVQGDERDAFGFEMGDHAAVGG